MNGQGSGKNPTEPESYEEGTELIYSVGIDLHQGRPEHGVWMSEHNRVMALVSRLRLKDWLFWKSAFFGMVPIPP